MAAPTKYQREYSFTDYQANNPSQPLPGPQVDNELENIEQSLNGTIAAVNDVRRADGALVNEIVTLDSLAPEVREQIGEGATAARDAAAASAVAAAGSAAASASSAGAAAGSAETAATSAGQAMTYRNSASTYSDLADSARTGAQTARDFAAQWASAPEGVVVDDGVNTPDKSAYHWAMVAEGTASGALPDGSVTTTKIADEAVTLAKLTPALQASIEGAPEIGLGQARFGGIWEQIGRRRTSAVADIVISGLEPYSKLRITGYMTPANDGVAGLMEVSTDNGQNWISSAAAYSYALRSSTTTTVSAAVADSTRIDMAASNIGNAPGKALTFEATFNNFNQALAMSGVVMSGGINASDLVHNATIRVGAAGTTARNALRIRFATGNIAYADLTIEGVRDDADKWRKVPYSWSLEPQMIRSMAEWRGKLYAGSSRPEAGGAEVWALGTNGLRRRTAFGRQRTNCLMVGPDDALYVGVGTPSTGVGTGAALLGRYFNDDIVGGQFDPDNGNYETIGTFTDHAFVYCMAIFDGKVHFGLMNNDLTGIAEVWRFDDPGLTKIGANGLNGWPVDDTAIGTYELWPYGGYLYASTYGGATGEGRILRWDGSSWEEVPPPATHIPLAFATYNGDLVVGLHNGEAAIANPIQRLVDDAWVALGTAPAEWEGAWLPNHMITGPDGHLYVGFGGDLGKLMVWRFDGTDWKKLGGNGLNGSWVNPVGITPATAEWFYRMAWHQGRLYAGTAANGGRTGAVWEMTP